MKLQEFIDTLPKDFVVHEIVYNSPFTCKALVSFNLPGSPVEDVLLDCSQGMAAKTLNLPLDNFWERFLRVSGLLKIRLKYYAFKAKRNYNKKTNKENGFKKPSVD